jgi:hypothetical protein
MGAILCFCCRVVAVVEGPSYPDELWYEDSWSSPCETIATAGMLPWNTWTSAPLYDTERNAARYSLMLNQETRHFLLPPLWIIVAEYAADVAFVRWRWKHWHKRKQFEFMSPHTIGICQMATSKRLQVTDRELARVPLRFRETDLHLFRPDNFFGLIACEDDARQRGTQRIRNFIEQEQRAIDQMIKECIDKDFALRMYQFRRGHMYWNADSI